MIINKKLLLYTPAPEPPAAEYPPDNTIWYWTSDENIITTNLGSYTINTYTDKGVLIYADEASFSGNLRGNNKLTKIMLPDNWTGYLGKFDFLHSCTSLTEIWVGAGATLTPSNGMCNGGVPLEHIYGHNNTTFTFFNNIALIQGTTCYLGTVNLDLRNSGVTTLGPLFMADMPLEGRTIYFDDTVLWFSGEYNVGTSGTTWTLYSYATVAPTFSQGSNIRGTVTCHIPVGSLASYQDKWSGMWGTITYIEDL